MMKNLNDISTLFKGVTYTGIKASKEEKVRKRKPSRVRSSRNECGHYKAGKDGGRNLSLVENYTQSMLYRIQGQFMLSKHHA